MLVVALIEGHNSEVTDAIFYEKPDQYNTSGHRVALTYCDADGCLECHGGPVGDGGARPRK